MGQGGLQENSLAPLYVAWMVRDQANVKLLMAALDGIIATCDPHIPPPTYEGDALRAELDALIAMQEDEERVRRQPEILAEIDDIIPNFLAIFEDAAGAPVSLIRLMVLLQDAGLALAAHYKDKFDRPRPHLMDHGINPMVTVPNHSAYPSGHATQAYLIAHGLAEVFGHDPGVIAESFDVAHRIRENREWAGVHFASDGDCGAIIAQTAFSQLRAVYDALFVQAIADVQSYDPGPSPFLGHGPLSERRKEAPALPPVEQWSLERMGISAAAGNIDKGGAGVTVGLVDMPVDVTHPTFARSAADHAIDAALAGTTDPAVWAASQAVLNLDYPAAADGRMAFSSKGAAHGTAMGGIIAGRHGPLCPLWGAAPEAKLIPVRCSTLLHDTHANRLKLAGAILRLAFGPTGKADVILVGPPFVRPAEDAYPDDWSGAVDLSKFAGACDPLALAILAASLAVPVVIPAGNDGTGEISYPGAPSDFTAVGVTLRDGDGRKAVEAMLAAAGLHIPREVLDRAETALAAGPDPFAGTGVIVVGSAKLSDPLDKASELVPARYSQFGPGLCCLAPSDRDEEPWVKPPTDGRMRYNYVPAPDILGHGGFSADPFALYSHHATEYGFGGTSAASAQGAGVIARVVEARRGRGEPVDGAAVRQAVVKSLGGAWTPKAGYGLLTVGVV